MSGPALLARWLRLTIHPGLLGLCRPGWLGLACLWIAPGGSFAEAPGVPPGPIAVPAQFETRIVPDAARPGEHVRLVTSVRVEPGWHIYSLLPQGEAGPSPTRLETRAEGLDLIGPAYETNPVHQWDAAFEAALWFHFRGARFYQNLRVRRGTPVGGRTLAQTVRFQVCNDRFCTPLLTQTLTATLKVESGEARPEYSYLLQTVDYVDSEGHIVTDATTLESALSEGLPNFLLLAAGFGLLALLTPCVFPMIPVTVSFFAAQARERRSSLGLALLFGTGLVVSYTGLGLGMTLLLGASGAGRFAASPWVNLAVFGFFVLFALALLDWIEPALPVRWVQGLDRAASRVRGPAGVLLMGVAFTATNFTCTMPFVGGLLLAASQGHMLWPLVGMLAFSAVFAAPFVALAMFPQWALALRGRSGPWMQQVRTVLALVEIGAALKFLSNADLMWGWGLLKRETLLILWMALALACAAVFLKGLVPPRGGESRTRVARMVSGLRARWFGGEPAESRRKAWPLVPGMAFLALAAYFGWGIAGGELDAYTEAYLPPRPVCGFTATRLIECEETVANLPWVRSVDEGLALAARTGKPIFIDFRGYTCVNCRWMDRRVLSKKPVLEALRNRFILVGLYTDGGPDAEKNLRVEVERFRTLALPYYVILGPDNRVLAIHAGILPSVAGFLDFLSQGTSRG